MSVSDISDLQVDRRSLRLARLYYFLLYGGGGFVSPFLNLFYVHQGLSGTQIGTVTSIGASITLIAAPFWAHRNAHWRSPRVALQIFVVLNALSLLWISQQTLFWGVAIATIFRALFTSSIFPLSDSMALTVSKARHTGFGSIRVWGSFGWVVFVPLSGWLVQQTSLQTSLIGAFVVLCVASLILFPIGARNFTVPVVSDESPPRFRLVVSKLLRNRSLLGVAAMIAIVGIANSGVAQFENVYMQQLGASNSLIGIINILSALVEIPCMLWADRLARRRGPYLLLLMAMLIFAGTRLLVLLVPSIPTIMVTEAFTGVSYSFYTVGLVHFISEATTAHETRTVLALYTVTLANLVSILSSPITGFVFDHLGARSLYLIAGVGYLLAWVGLQTLRQRAEPQTP